MGFGRRMMEAMEDMVRAKYSNIQKMAVISGIGAREYYKKHGYILKDEYMVRSV